MTTTYEIPLSPEPQTFSIQLAGTTYKLTTWWCDAAEQGGWIMDVADKQGNPLINGLPLVTGLDLLSQLTYLNIGGSLVVMGDAQPLAPPTFNDLGQEVHLYFLVP